MLPESSRSTWFNRSAKIRYLQVTQDHHLHEHILHNHFSGSSSISLILNQLRKWPSWKNWRWRTNESENEKLELNLVFLWFLWTESIVYLFVRILPKNSRLATNVNKNYLVLKERVVQVNFKTPCKCHICLHPLHWICHVQFSSSFKKLRWLLSEIDMNYLQGKFN